MNRTYRVLLSVTQLVLFAIAIILLVRLFIDPNYHKIGGVLASLVLPFLPALIQKVFKLKISFRLQLTYFIFLFAALFLGIDLDFYKTVPFFDKSTHLVSGALSVILAWYALLFFKADHIKKSFQAIFIICFCVAIGVLWEFFEFACDKLLGQSMQQLVSVGVDDTMYDLLAAIIGASIGTIILMRHTRKITKLSLAEPKKP